MVSSKKLPISIFPTKALMKFMSIRKKTLIMIFSVSLFLVFALYGISDTFLLGSFAGLEEHLVLRNVDRALLAFSSDIDQLNSTASDWAPWDETYAFMMDRNQQYVDKNLNVETLANLRLNLILLIDPSGRQVFARALDFRTRKELPVPKDLLNNLFSKGSLICRNESDMFKGIVVLPEGPLLISSQPILTSNWNGPVRGTLIMGRYLDSELEYLENIIQLPLTSSEVSSIKNGAKNDINNTINHVNTSSDLDAAESSLSKEKPVLIRPLSADSIAGYALISDVHGDPAVVLRLAMPRDIYQQGQATIYSLSLFILFSGLLFVAMTMLLLDRIVLSRVAQLSSNVRNIGLCGDISMRVQVSGRDELSSLAGMINDMLEKIERSESELRRSERLAAIGEVAMMIGHDLRNPLQAIVATTYLVRAKMDDLSDEVQKHLRDLGIVEDLGFIDKQSNYMNKIVSDLQDYSRPLSPKIADIHLNPFVTEVLSSIRIPENVEVHTEIDVHLAWQADPTMMERVLTNLITNAIQAMPRGGKVLVKGDSSEEGTALCIRDTGDGIPPEILPKIFNPLFTTKSKGMGLGLVVSKRLTEAQGGSLEISSVIGEGTVAVIQMPNGGMA